MRVPDAHDQTSPGGDTAGSVALGWLPGSTGTRTSMGHVGDKLTFLCQTSFQHMPRQQASRSSAPAHCRPGKRWGASPSKHRPQPRSPAPFWATGLENSHPYSKAAKKTLGLFVFFPAGAILESFASLPWLNREWLVLPNQLPAPLGDGHARRFRRPRHAQPGLQGVEMLSAALLRNWATPIPEGH